MSPQTLTGTLCARGSQRNPNLQMAAQEASIRCESHQSVVPTSSNRALMRIFRVTRTLLVYTSQPSSTIMQGSLTTAQKRVANDLNVRLRFVSNAPQRFGQRTHFSGTVPLGRATKLKLMPTSKATMASSYGQASARKVTSGKSTLLLLTS